MTNYVNGEGAWQVLEVKQNSENVISHDITFLDFSFPLGTPLARP